jgi:hypothetical protein
MFVRIQRRWITALCVLTIAALSGCKASDTLSPSSQLRPGSKPARDDDPSTCRNGYSIFDGHVYCNPDI